MAMGVLVQVEKEIDLPVLLDIVTLPAGAGL